MRADLAEVCARHGIRLLVRFGSTVPGGLPPRPESDIDLAIAVHRDRSRPSLWDVLGDFGELFPEGNADVVFLADADPLFRWEIVNRGQLLYGDEDEFAELRAFAFRDFVDSSDLRALEYGLFEKKMKWLAAQLHAAS